MLHGKKGFERVKWAFEHVLNEVCTFLICGDIEGLAGDAKERAVEAQMQHSKDVRLPPFPKQISEDDYEQAADLLEYLHLAMLGSPRILASDDVDTHFSRYRVPDHDHAATKDVITYRWHGLIPGTFAHQVLLNALKSCEWVVVSAEGFVQGEAYTVLVDSGRSVTWEWKE